jgi:hypothetical protein
VARGDDDVVEVLVIHPVFHQVMRGDGEVALGLVVADHADGGGKADPVADAGLLHPALDVVDQHGARRIAGDLLAEVFLEGIVGEFQALFRAVGPEIAVHAAMHRLAVFIEAGAPGVVPQPAPVGLLFKADDLGMSAPLALADWNARSCARPDGPAPMTATFFFI